MSLIPAGNSIAVMAALFALAGMAFYAERFRLGAIVSGNVVVIVSGIVAANLKIIPHQAPAYDFVFAYIVPALVPLFLFQADIRRILLETGKTLIAFLIAVVGTVAGVVVALLALDLKTLAPESGLTGAQLEGGIGGLFAATYIGGSVNYAALGDVTGLVQDSSFFSAATAADNIFGVIYLVILALLPGLNWLARFYPGSDHGDAENANEEPAPPATPMSLSLSIALALAIVALGDLLAAFFSIPDWRYAIITALTIILATAIPNLHLRLAGSFDIGIALAFVFFGAMAAGADVTSMLGVAPLLILLVIILLVVHAVFVFTVGSLFRLSLPELIIASNACTMGPATATAMAAGRGWVALVTPAVLVGVFGYVIGTFVGTAIFKLWP
ncbi:MAG: DUF819 family protein [Pseudomonadota bacterium]